MPTSDLLSTSRMMMRLKATEEHDPFRLPRASEFLPLIHDRTRCTGVKEVVT